MKPTASVLMMGIALGAMTGCATEKSSAARATPPPPTVQREVTKGDKSVTETELVTLTVRVVAVDYDKRIVTVRGPKGKVVELKVGDQVRNLAQVKKGDDIVAQYYESVAVEVKKPGAVKPGSTEAEGVARAALGQKPEGIAARTETVVATIQKIDRSTQMVTLKGASGKLVEVHVKDASRLEGVKKGDRVEITYTQALAISVEAIAKKQ